MNIFVQNDGTITLQNLTDLVNGVVTAIPGATVAFSLIDSTNTTLLSGVAMAYVTGTASDYAGAILSSFNPSPINNPMTLVITATFSGKTATFTRSKVNVITRSI